MNNAHCFCRIACFFRWFKLYTTINNAFISCCNAYFFSCNALLRCRDIQVCHYNVYLFCYNGLLYIATVRVRFCTSSWTQAYLAARLFLTRVFRFFLLPALFCRWRSGCLLSIVFFFFFINNSLSFFEFLNHSMFARQLGVKQPSLFCHRRPLVWGVSTFLNIRSRKQSCAEISNVFFSFLFFSAKWSALSCKRR